MAAQKKYSSLGRGLDALISTDTVKTGGSSSISEIAINKIKANPNQPRREFDPEALQELADSIKEIGIIQPITLRQMEDGTYQIIAGERRFRASQLAGLTALPAYIRTADDENVMEMALIENIQREDLNAMEIALAYQHLLDEYDLTQERLSERVGKKRTTIANYLRLLKLPAQIQMALKNHELDMGHARALLSLDNPVDQINLFQDIQIMGYSVRKVEEIIKKMKSTKAPAPAKPAGEYDLLKKHLSTFFNTDVQLTCNAKGKGKIAITFKDEDELQRIITLLDKLKA
ncbi:MAG: ParB/RepB/Spo0J family partition protein [Bacteroidaceae bacterium]|nr:ParB/RepB/Spo0J family partition protein [Bacteroidaceae bacterium]MBR5148390.1 ParB/RepB/Spo0J family partition protein [Bacteroidaceae bacterium]